MKHHWTYSLIASFCAYTFAAQAGMAPENDPAIDAGVWQAIDSVKNPPAKSQSAPAFAVSLMGPNRIAVTDKKIINAIYDATQLDVQTDSMTGQIFIFPKSQDPIALFLTTEDKETYALTLIPQSIRSQEIVLGARKIKHEATRPYMQKTFSQAIESAPDLDMKVTRLIRALARDELPDGFHSTNRCGKNCIKSLTSETLLGRVLIHKNTSSRVVTLEEKFFYEAGVLAVSIENASLNPKESTRVFIVSKNNSSLLLEDKP